jgi:hypothetical protein
MPRRALVLSIISTCFAAFPITLSSAIADQVPVAWEQERPWTGYIEVERPLIVQKASSNIIYLNRCIDGCTLTPGYDDSRANTSQIINFPVNIPPFAYGDQSWQQVVDCVREMYAPFGVEITEHDPGDRPHFEAIVAGNPSDAGFPPYVGGVSPFECSGIDNAITYSFAEVWGDDPRIICEVVAQETAHAFGLDHEFYCLDPMTYLTDCGEKSFQDHDAECGEDEARICKCGGLTQNSYQRILGEFGPGQLTPPEVRITQPQDGRQVTPGFLVRASITDNVEVQRADLYIDGELFASVESEPWTFNAPADLARGEHQIEVRAHDNANTPGSHAITVIQRDLCASASDCYQDETCVEGRCVLGPGSPGGLGEECAANPECASGLCGQDGEGTMHCVEECQLGGNGCPGGFQCLDAGSRGVCWPSVEERGGGCAIPAGESGQSPLAPILFGIAFGALFLFRRRG